MTRRVLLGWRNSSPQAALAFFAPEPLEETGAAALVAGYGGALGGRIYVVRAAFSVRIRLVRRKGQPPAFQQVPVKHGLSETAFKGLVTPIVPSAQRDPAVPACQISLNLVMISDERCSIQLMPPFLAPNFRRWPGSLVCGRYPVWAWPRPLNAVLEWQDPNREWVIARGDPMAYVMPIYEEPGLAPDLVEARLTPALKRHLARIEGVSSFGRNVGPMFAEAERRRPARLVEAKELAAEGR